MATHGPGTISQGLGCQCTVCMGGTLRRPMRPRPQRMAHDAALASQGRCRCTTCAANRAAETRRAQRARAAAERAERAAVVAAARSEQVRQAELVTWQTREGPVVALGAMQDRHLFYAARMLMRTIAERSTWGGAMVRQRREQQLSAMRLVLRSRGLRPPEGPEDVFRPRSEPWAPGDTTIVTAVEEVGQTRQSVTFPDRAPAETAAGRPLAPLQRPGRRELVLPPGDEPEW